LETVNSAQKKDGKNASAACNTGRIGRQIKKRDATQNITSWRHGRVGSHGITVSSVLRKRDVYISRRPGGANHNTYSEGWYKLQVKFAVCDNNNGDCTVVIMLVIAYLYASIHVVSVHIINTNTTTAHITLAHTPTPFSTHINSTHLNSSTSSSSNNIISFSSTHQPQQHTHTPTAAASTQHKNTPTTATAAALTPIVQ
jgi:hypothetical protein